MFEKLDHAIGEYEQDAFSLAEKNLSGAMPAIKAGAPLEQHQWEIIQTYTEPSKFDSMANIATADAITRFLKESHPNYMCLRFLADQCLSHAIGEVLGEAFKNEQFDDIRLFQAFLFTLFNDRSRIIGYIDSCFYGHYTRLGALLPELFEKNPFAQGGAFYGDKSGYVIREDDPKDDGPELLIS